MSRSRAGVALILAAGCHPPDDAPVVGPPDTAGCTLTRALDADADGALDSRSTVTWDARGDEIATSWESLSEGRWDTSATTRDESGCATAYTSEHVTPAHRTWTDWTATCDPGGNPTARDATCGADDEASACDVSYVNTYEATLLVAQSVVEWDGDEVSDAWDEAYKYADGLRTRVARYRDGELQTLETTDWLAPDQPSVRYYADHRRYYYEDELWEYDDLGRETSDLIDTGGTPLGLSRTEHAWAGDTWRPTGVTLDVRDDGEIDAAWTWDCSAVWPWICAVERDGDEDGGAPPDGAPDEVETWVWTCG